MGKYSNTILDRDRAFDIGMMGELLEEGEIILSAAKDISEKIKDAALRTGAAYEGVPAGYKVEALSRDVSDIKLKLSNDSYQDTLDRMKGILNKLMEDVPGYDGNLAGSMDSLEETADSLRGRIEELKGFLEATDAGISCKEFNGQLEEMIKGWDRTTEDLQAALMEIENDMMGVAAAATPYSHDPVNLSTGNFVYDHEDMKVGGEIPLSFHRYYNAKDRRKGVLGRCFLHNYESCLEEKEETGKVTVSMKDGQKKTFKRLEDGTYRSLYSATETLVRERGEKAAEEKCGEEGRFILTELTGNKTIYNERGQMTRQEDRFGKGITFSYNEMGKLERAETDNGASLTYSYDGDGMLSCVEDHSGRHVELSYERGKVATVKVPSGSVYTYRYGKNGRMEEMVNPRGYTAVKNTYDDKRRVTCQEFPDGGHMEYAYDDKKRLVVLTERNGSKTTYVHDSKYRNTDILYEDGTKEHFAYNSKNQRILHTDRNGNTTRMAYDNRGNLTQVINALGEKMNLTYDAGNNLVNLKINGVEKQKNCFDGKGNLSESKDALSRKTSFSYSGAGLPEAVTLPDGSCIRIEYDEKGNIASLTDAAGGKTSYAYDGLNRVVRVTDPCGERMELAYDSADNILSLTNAAGDVRSFAYNESNKVTEIKDFDGSVVKRSYNALNRPEKVTDQLGRVTEIRYDTMWNPTCVILPDGGETHYRYDKNNRLESIEDAAGHVVSYTYDGNGNRTSERDELGNTTRFTYDAAGRLTHVQGEEGAEMSYAYDAEGHVTEAEDTLGNRVFLEYDKAGQLIRESNTLGSCREYAYTPLGRVESVTDEAGRRTGYAYLSGGRLSEVLHSDGTKESYTYDAAGRVETYTDRNGFVTSYEYDCLGRAVRIFGSGGEEKKYAYDAVGNVTKVTDACGNTTRYEYSLTGQLTKVTDALGNETEYRYDVCDRLIEVLRHGEDRGTGETEDVLEGALVRAKKQNCADSACRVTRYQRNKLGQVESVTDALGNTERYTYDAKGQLIEKLDKEGYLTKYGYTAQGDVNRIAYADGREVKLSYNPLRQLEEMEDWLGITRIENDAMGRALKVQYPDGKEVSYTYGKSGERTSLTYPDGRQVAYSYDNELRLSGLSDGNGTITYSYDGAGRLAKKVFPGGMETSYAYDAAGHLSELIHKDGEGILDRYSYQYDLLGNKTAIEKRRRGLPEESGLYAYGYDALGRLSTVAKDGKALRSYGYDAFGNRTLLKEGSAETTYAYNAMDQLVSKADALGEETYAYDKRGNLNLILENGALKNRYTYGALNRLEQAVKGNGETSSYLYNGLGHRVGKDNGRLENVAGAQRESDKILQGTGLPDPFSRLEGQELCPERRIRYIIDLTKSYHNLLQKEEEAAVQTFLWDGNVAGMWEDTGASAERTAGRSADSATSRYYLQDELGSPIRLFGEGGGLEESYGYDEFGQDLYGNQGLLQPFGYTGYQADRIAGTYYAQAREYRAELGRFVSEDPIRKGLNWYVYCQNNSIKNVDPLGLEQIVVSGGVYSEKKRNNNIYYYEFVDASIAQINEWNKQNNNENITWIIADNGWSELNKSELEKEAQNLNVNIQFIEDKEELFDYLNNKNGTASERIEDKITDISVFSHGLMSDNGTISLGYDYSNEYNLNLDIHVDDIDKINIESFAKDINSNFYSCNIGTSGEDSFAQEWANKFGGTTTAFKGKTDYAKVPDNSFMVRIVRKLTQKLYGVSVFGGNPNFPTAGENAEQVTFLQNNLGNNCGD